MNRVTIKNILDNYIPPTYLRKGTSGRPLSWTYNVYLLMADIPITLFWIICAFFSHSSYKEAFVVCAWVWGLNALVSSAVVAGVLLSHNEELVNKWTSPITFLMLIFCPINVNLSLSLIDEHYEIIGMQIMVNVTLVLLFWTGVNIVVHFIIAIISIYKGKNVGEQISNTYIILLICLVIFLS